MNTTTECPECEGSGYVGEHVCPTCKGVGEIAPLIYCATCGNPADEPNYAKPCCSGDNMLEA